jgi:peroxiredoxin Q/BCP
MNRLICASLLAVVAALTQNPAAAPALPEVGKPVPAFRLNDHTGKVVEIAPDPKATEGNWTVLAFYPKAFTSGCTQEVCSMRDSAEELLAMGVDVYALSLDDVSSIAAFAEAEQLNYLLLSDPDGSAARKLGVMMPDKPYTQRVTFVLDEKRTVRLIDRAVDVAKHGSDLVATIKKLRG